MLPGTCKDVARLLSAALDRRLTRQEWLGAHLHLLVCPGCRHFREQMALLLMAGRSSSDRGGHVAPSATQPRPPVRFR
ncbi:zf-HC2 domain-containing protein [Burkholderia cenocepacia]|uniref:zf-HC2 domain-containing protein n=1 Tax=Burkholderia cenocepacia TaxID=95486 RepID=UPI001F4AD0A7|nr:zf-HC2 domain-containing protein [Burkholderia cenocepacia]